MKGGIQGVASTLTAGVSGSERCFPRGKSTQVREDPGFSFGILKWKHF